MKTEHEKLLSQLFVTWDITEGIGERDFGFVLLRERLSNPTSIDVCNVVGGYNGLYTEAYRSVEDFEEGFEDFLRGLVTFPSKLSAREGLDSIEFDLGCGRIRAPGPIGVLICHRKPGEFLARRPIVLGGRFEVVR